ncbi:hypothetical protein [Leucothrix arctica]|uniref:hypothetical protein n=1 Tax=Leucothrix arctica TaxID=1481894 RepID=UPI001BAD5C2A|nr:hypothetical protein [Leucothrix arctica]
MSIDPVYNHQVWAEDIEEIQGTAVGFPISAGRNFDEILRVLKAIQVDEKHGVATSVNLVDGDDFFIDY